jgi:hypothetical protein
MKPYVEIKHNLLEAIEREQLAPDRYEVAEELEYLYWMISQEVTFDGMINTLKKFLDTYKRSTILEAFLP